MTHFYPHPSHTSAPAQRRRAWWPSVALAGLLVSSAPAWADDDCEVPAAQWQPRTAVQSMATQRGWQVERIGIDDGWLDTEERQRRRSGFEIGGTGDR